MPKQQILEINKNHNIIDYNMPYNLLPNEFVFAIASIIIC